MACCQKAVSAMYKEGLRSIRLKHLGNVLGHVELVKIHCVHAITNISSNSTAAFSANTTKGNGINAELSGTVEGDVEQNQNTLCACRLLGGRIRNVLETA